MLKTMPQDVVLNLYVPREGRRLNIADGSVIVGLVRTCGTDERIEAYYEGSIYGQDMGFDTMLQIAAGRMADRAPTSAFGFYDPADLEQVGTVARSEKLKGWIVTGLSGPAALSAWIGHPVAIGGSEEQRRRAAGIAYGELPESGRARVDAAIRAGGDAVELLLAGA